MLIKVRGARKYFEEPFTLTQCPKQTFVEFNRVQSYARHSLEEFYHVRPCPGVKNASYLDGRSNA
jgi:hypothetical protein